MLDRPPPCQNDHNFNCFSLGHQQNLKFEGPNAVKLVMYICKEKILIINCDVADFLIVQSRKRKTVKFGWESVFLL